MNKVFGIGVQRTGLTSLTGALNALGIATRQFPWQLYDDRDDPLIDAYQGFTDFPIPLLFAEFDRKYPGSKFIHTIRDEDEWLRSVSWLFSTGATKFAVAWQRGVRFHTDFYGTITFDAERFLQRYRQYNQETAAYFADRPGDYLQLNLVAQPAFGPLCAFLDRPPPGTPFPHRNQRESGLRLKLRRWRRRLTTRYDL